MKYLKPMLLWSSLLLVSLVIHLLLSSRAAVNMLSPAARSSGENAPVEILLDVPEVAEEKDKLVFEDPIEFEPPPVLVPSAALAPPPPDVNLAMEAAAGGSTAAGFSTPLLSDSFATAGKGLAGYGTGIGTGLSNSTNRFAAYVQGLRETGLDVVFVVDTTGSMDWVIDEVRSRIVDIVDAVRMLVPVSRFGIVAYRDYGSPGFVTRAQPLTYSLGKLTGFLNGLTAEGGGSLEEAVYEGLRVAVTDGGWRLGAKRVIILIGDAPPHSDNVSALFATSKAFAAADGQLSTLDVSFESNPAMLEATLGRPVNRALYRDKPMLSFQQLADTGNGVAATMDGDVRITRQLVSLIMGGQFATEMALLMEGL